MCSLRTIASQGGVFLRKFILVGVGLYLVLSWYFSWRYPPTGLLLKYWDVSLGIDSFTKKFLYKILFHYLGALLNGSVPSWIRSETVYWKELLTFVWMSIKVYKVFGFRYSYCERVASWVIVQWQENLAAGVAIGLEKNETISAQKEKWTKKIVTKKGN